MSDAYLDFLRSKIPQAEVCGFEPLSEPHPSLFQHQVDVPTLFDLAAEGAVKIGEPV